MIKMCSVYCLVFFQPPRCHGYGSFLVPLRCTLFLSCFVKFNVGKIKFNVGKINFNVGKININVGKINFDVGKINEPCMSLFNI